MDWSAGGIWVRRNYTVVWGKKVIHTPKTHRSNRPVDVGPDVLEVLRQHREKQEKKRLEMGEDWVFTTSLGTPIEPGNLHREFVRIIQRAGVKRIRFHDLRDTHVSLLALAGMDFLSG
ncbi:MULTISPECIES: tyrosine-type recombinase/integrase [unclassified Meiothermus]|uniref:tyrosine-type recombinase/integrase n=1 Tax=unclassified Meiothermus TaxID=370471 RepID=UPI001314FB00|nr:MULTISPECIES: tyrosine-type recombinase/integrase [unclassified Meiothermus]